MVKICLNSLPTYISSDCHCNLKGKGDTQKRKTSRKLKLTKFNLAQRFLVF